MNSHGIIVWQFMSTWLSRLALGVIGVLLGIMGTWVLWSLEVIPIPAEAIRNSFGPFIAIGVGFLVLSEIVSKVNRRLMLARYQNHIFISKYNHQVYRLKDARDLTLVLADPDYRGHELFVSPKSLQQNWIVEAI